MRGATALRLPRQPQVLDEAESIVQQLGIAAVATDLTDLSVAFTVTDLPVYVVLWLPRVQVTLAGRAFIARITDAAGTMMSFGTVESTRDNGTYSCLGFEKITAPGDYFRKAVLVRSFGADGTATNGLNSLATVSRLTATEQPPLMVAA